MKLQINRQFIISWFNQLKDHEYQKYKLLEYKRILKHIKRNLIRKFFNFKTY